MLVGGHGAADQRPRKKYSNNSDRSRSWPAEGETAADARTQTLPFGARIAAGHAFVQNLRRGHYELATDVSPPLRPARAFTELALAM